MTQDPPQSWPRREPGRSGTRPLAVDPLTGELIESDPPAGGEFWVPAPRAEPDAPERAADDQRPAPWSPPPPPAAAYPVPPPAQGWPHPAYGYPGSPPPYGAPAYGGAVARPTNGMAIASLVLGAVWLFWIGSVLALVFGYVARNQIRRTGEGGDGLAVAGIVLGWVGIGFLTLTVVAGVLDGS